MELIISISIGLFLGVVISKFMTPKDENELTELEKQHQSELAQVKAEALLSVEEKEKAIKSAVDREEKLRREAFKEREDRLIQREKSVEHRDQQLTRREKDLSHREKDLTHRDKQLVHQEEQLDKKLKEADQKLEAQAQLSQEEAKALVIAGIEKQTKLASVERIRQIEETAKNMAEEQARTIISMAIQRYANEHVTEQSVVTIPLPNDEIKGRIIGKEGRNVRAFSHAAGCDLIIDDTPGAVVISCFNPIRREIAKRALEKLIQDGRINVARIEEVLRRTGEEMEQVTRQYGESAALELEISNLHPDILKALGRLYFITSFGQNVLQHSVEVGILAGIMAAELGLSPKIARRAGLLHDLGKTIEQQVDGDHGAAGATLCRKCGEAEIIVQAVANHHNEQAQDSVIAQLVGAANKLSSSRPGARRATLAAQIQRVTELEDLVKEFSVVERCYALKTGKEIRVIIDNAKTDDASVEWLARDIAKKIEDELTFQQEIRVVVIRPTRVVTYAR
jgi:ribonuclease Y